MPSINCEKSLNSLVPFINLSQVDIKDDFRGKLWIHSDCTISLQKPKTVTKLKNHPFLAWIYRFFHNINHKKAVENFVKKISTKDDLLLKMLTPTLSDDVRKKVAKEYFTCLLLSKIFKSELTTITEKRCKKFPKEKATLQKELENTLKKIEVDIDSDIERVMEQKKLTYTEVEMKKSTSFLESAIGETAALTIPDKRIRSLFQSINFLEFQKDDFLTKVWIHTDGTCSKKNPKTVTWLKKSSLFEWIYRKFNHINLAKTIDNFAKELKTAEDIGLKAYDKSLPESERLKALATLYTLEFRSGVLVRILESVNAKRIKKDPKKKAEYAKRLEGDVKKVAYSFDPRTFVEIVKKRNPPFWVQMTSEEKVEANYKTQSLLVKAQKTVIPQ